jgi:hypothetical protein
MSCLPRVREVRTFRQLTAAVRHYVTITRSMLLISILASTACAGKRSSPASLPEDPSAAVATFLDAVRAKDLTAMGALWGSDRGPANDWMKSDERQKRLVVIQTHLVHDSYAIQPGVLPGGSEQERVVRVQLTRGRCTPVVPFTARQYRGRWIVSAIDLEAAGNPARPCP